MTERHTSVRVGRRRHARCGTSPVQIANLDPNTKTAADGACARAVGSLPGEIDCPARFRRTATQPATSRRARGRLSFGAFIVVLSPRRLGHAAGRRRIARGGNRRQADAFILRRASGNPLGAPAA